METEQDFKNRIWNEGRKSVYDAAHEYFELEGDPGWTERLQEHFAPLLAGTRWPVRRVQKEVNSWKQKTRNLLKKKKRDDKPNIEEDYLWIYKNLGNLAVKESDALNGGAFNALTEIQADPTLNRKFIGDVMLKFVPKEGETAEAKRFKDDGRAQLDILAEVERASVEAKNGN